MTALMAQPVMEINGRVPRMSSPRASACQLMNAHDVRKTTTDNAISRVVTAIHSSCSRRARKSQRCCPKARSPFAGSRDYADYLGTAGLPQLVDTCSTTVSNPTDRVKNLGDDLAEGNPTLPLIHALKAWQ